MEGRAGNGIPRALPFFPLPRPTTSLRTKQKRPLRRREHLKEKISLNIQVDSGSTCSILPIGVYKEISSGHGLQDLNTTVRPTLSLYD